MTRLSEKFDEALKFASSAHREQTRKGTTIPYITHLMAVASIVGENGGDEELMIAALLHDSMEDQGISHDEIKKHFGERVAGVVEACSDSFTKPKPPWRERKEKHIAHLRKANSDVRLVSAADKIHNANSILSDFRKEGVTVWKRFNAGPKEILWYYESVVEALRDGWYHPLIDELAETVKKLAKIVEGRS